MLVVIHAKVNIYGNRCSYPRETYRADKDKNLCVRGLLKMTLQNIWSGRFSLLTPLEQVTTVVA